MLLWVFLDTWLTLGSHLCPTTEKRSIKSSGCFHPSCSNITINIAYAHKYISCWNKVCCWELKYPNYFAICRQQSPHLLISLFLRTSVVRIWTFLKMRAEVILPYNLCSLYEAEVACCGVLARKEGPHVALDDAFLWPIGLNLCQLKAKGKKKKISFRSKVSQKPATLLNSEKISPKNGKCKRPSKSWHLIQR